MKPRYWILIFVLALAAGAVLGAVSVWLEQPVYAAEATVAVNTFTGTDGAYAALSRNTDQASRLEATLNNGVFRKLLLEEAGILRFSGNLEARHTPSTNLVTVRVTDRTPEIALEVLLRVLENAPAAAGELIGEVRYELLEVPALPDTPVESVSILQRILISMALAGGLTLGAFLWITLDRTPRDTGKVDLFARWSAIWEQARKLWVTGAALILAGAVVLTAWCCGTYVPRYRAEAVFAVRLEAGEFDAQAADRLDRIVPAILTGSLLERKVEARMGQSAPTLTAFAQTGPSIVTLRAEDTDPQRAWDAVQAALELYPEVLEAVAGPTTRQLLAESGMPQSPENPLSVSLCLTGGGLLGAAAFLALALRQASRKAVNR